MKEKASYNMAGEGKFINEDGVFDIELCKKEEIESGYTCD